MHNFDNFRRFETIFYEKQKKNIYFELETGTQSCVTFIHLLVKNGGGESIIVTFL